jgi:hypothetical protein
MKRRKKKKSGKFERCVRAVKKSRSAVNPWAVCHASVGRRDPKRKKITATEWERTHRDYKTVIKGVPYVLMLDKHGATVLQPVQIVGKRGPHKSFGLRDLKRGPDTEPYSHRYKVATHPLGRTKAKTFASYGDAQRHAWDLLRSGVHRTSVVYALDRRRGWRKVEAWKIGPTGLFQHVSRHKSPGGAGRDPRRAFVNRPRHARRSPMGYEHREISDFMAKIRRVEKAPLAERKEGAREFAHAMAHDPALVAERVGWLLDGNYGQGAYIKAREVARSPRMNRVAWLTQTVGAVEWHSPWAMTRASWKKMTPSQKKALDDAVTRVIYNHLKEGE